MRRNEMMEEVERWRNASGYIEEEFRNQYKETDAKIWKAEEAYREYVGNEPLAN